MTATSHESLVQSCAAAMQADPAGPLQGWIAWVKENLAKLDKDTVIAVSEAAFDFVAKFDIPQIPEALELAFEAWLKSQIRPLVERLYAAA